MWQEGRELEVVVDYKIGEYVRVIDDKIQVQLEFSRKNIKESLIVVVLMVLGKLVYFFKF